ncbi:ATP-binding cassette domain-containing protein [Actinophytocola oryzae]|uniref:ATP-binding cassette subfamily C protein n=1 Tax=Actinophytocola oryzae TaxID=502181 RepID=A0A4R7W122_9PSEU|nr:ABC transporter ATP-binding protein [Actinophytocola oryzae]TDV55217.1 ATP-binding cassette subfamily C protein [Actinophytocola oryzae]
MRRELRYAVRSFRAAPTVALVAWSVPEALPAATSGFVIANAVDRGFLAGRPVVGLFWLASLLVVAGAGALGTRMVFRRLGELAEPFRDGLVERVVGGAIRNGIAERPDHGALARLTRQVEVARDTYAGLVIVIRGFLVTVVGVVVGVFSLAPAIAFLLLPPFVLGLGGFVAMLGLAANRQRAAVLADEKLSAAAGQVFAGTRDVVACGTEKDAAALVKQPIDEQAAAERALAGVAALRTACFALGGWVPLLLLLFAGPALVRDGLTAGELLGGATYVLFGLQPALQSFVAGVGGSGLRFVITLGRVLDASDVPPAEPRHGTATGYAVELRKVTFAYGPHAEPVIADLDLSVVPGEHLAVVGPSGIGKSTLVSLVCGLRRPDRGEVLLGETPAAELDLATLAATRVLIPQEAYVFTGTLRDNLTYLNPGATTAEIELAAAKVGARFGDYDAQVSPLEMSSGERQLVALVRAYLSPAPLIVLDEATCHLDPAAERRAELAFAERPGTLVVIAHRISSALRAERVLVLDGAGAAVGDHATLLRTSPLYRELLGHWEAGRTPASQPA